MAYRGIRLAVLCLAMPLFALAQASGTSRADILRKILSEEAAARVDMPLGGEGLLLSDLGEINDQKLQKQIQKNGRSIQAGRVVRVTNIEFGSKSIDIELDGGGKAKKRFGDHVQISVGGAGTAPSSKSAAQKVIGSRISLQFPKKVPSELTSDQLKQLLLPVLDFTKKTVTATNIESLPPVFKAAVLARKAEIGMDQETVVLSMGIPDKKFSEKINGVDQEDWQYYGRGKNTFVTFENSVVVKITEY